MRLFWKMTGFALLASALITSAALADTACCASGTSCSATQAVKAPDNTLTTAEKEAGWKLIFDGKTFNDWGCTDPNSKAWVIDNGAILYTVQGGGMMYSKERYGDFELKIDFMVDKGTNSGIFFRWDKLNDPVQTGIEMQVLDSASAKPASKWDCGAVYDVLAPSENAMKPALEWNTAYIRCKDNFLSITLNGKSVVAMDLNRYTTAHKNVDGTDNKFNTAYKDMVREGYIGLQDHGGKVWYKNIKVRELK